MRAFSFLPFLLVLVTDLPAQTIYVRPYVQPGDGSSLSGSDVKVLSWLTDQTPGAFTAEFKVAEGEWRTAQIERMAFDFGKAKEKPKAKTPGPATPRPAPEPVTTIEELTEKGIEESGPALAERERHFLKYSAMLSGLPFDSKVAYRVRLGETTIREATFKTRVSAGKPTRCVLIGDLASAKPEQNGIAWQISRQKPDFIVALGDIVYPAGRVGEYMHHFWGTYNDVRQPGPKTGAPLMATVPIYPVLGNHDTDARKLPDYPDAFGAFYFFSVPLNGPGLGPWNLPLGKSARAAATFRRAVGTQYPAMSFYSFDYGPAHFLVLDSNSYTTKHFDSVVPWIERDLRDSSQQWKIVCFHAPAFHTSKEHFTEQKMRLIEPTFAKGGVDMVFAGHVHNYQRSKPLRFTPDPPKRDRRGRVNGEFTNDDSFDGAKDTTPQGIIHVVSGGGGAKLYSPDFKKTAETLREKHRRNYVPFTAMYYAEKHSFTTLDLSREELVLHQWNIDGQQVDQLKITKPH